MNRKQRRKALAGRTKIKDLPQNQRLVLDALISAWLNNTEVGQSVIKGVGGSATEALISIRQMYDRGLVEFIGHPGEEGKISFAVKASPLLEAMLGTHSAPAGIQ